jgi:F0F1-type ATP synthase membrane subunit c/vacuolar-type H+-ATPase subunit K
MTPEMELALQASQMNADAMKAIAMGLAAGIGVLGPGILKQQARSHQQCSSVLLSLKHLLCLH